MDTTGEGRTGDGVIGDGVEDGGDDCEEGGGIVEGGRALLVARFTSSETTDKSGEDDPFISDVPVAAVTTLGTRVLVSVAGFYVIEIYLSSIVSTSIPSALSIALSGPD